MLRWDDYLAYLGKYIISKIKLFVVYYSQHLQTGIFHTSTISGDFNSMDLDLDICNGDIHGKRGLYRSGCNIGQVCSRYDHSPQHETVVFDDIWNSLVSGFRVMFRDNWMVVSWFVQDGVHKSTWLPFYVLFFVSIFALTSLFPGAMMVNLQSVLLQELNEVIRCRTCT